MLDYPEVLQLLLAALFVPLGYRGLQALSGPVRRWFLIALSALLVSYVTTILEGYTWPEFFNTIEHLGYAVSGVCFAIGARNGAGRTYQRRSGGSA